MGRVHDIDSGYYDPPDGYEEPIPLDGYYDQPEEDEMPGDVSRSYKGPRTGEVPSWMDEPAQPTLPRPKWHREQIDREPDHGQYEHGGPAEPKAP